MGEVFARDWNRMTTDRLTFGSFCSGIGAPEAAWLPLGWEPKFFSEIEPFPSAVLAHHYPHVPNLGDMTKIDVAALPDVDLWVAGTPCQAFSVAGLRKSLSDDRGNLTLHFCRMVDERNPRIVVWENVPGVLSTKDNAFGCFLAGLVGEGEPLVCGDGSWPDAGMVAGPRRSAAWRVLDAQYVGLAQRRRRVFVVSFRTRDGVNPGAVLFEPESVPRDSAPRREAGAGVAGSPRARAAVSSGQGWWDESDIGATLRAQDSVTKCDTLIPETTHTLRADGFDASEDGTGRGTPLVPVPIQNATRGKDQNGLGIAEAGDPMFTLDRASQHAIAFQPIPIDMRQASRGAMMTNNRGDDACSGGAPGTGIGKPGDPCPSISLSHPPAIAFSCKDHGQDAGDLSPTLRAMQHRDSSPNAGGQVAVAFTDTRGDGRGSGVQVTGDIANTLHCAKGISEQQSVAVAFQERGREGGRNVETQTDLAYSLNAPSGGGRRQELNVATPTMAVRRLTPRECERLQGFPDDFTLIPNAKPKKINPAKLDRDYIKYLMRGGVLSFEECCRAAADGPRYRALGNSMATTVVRWIGWRIALVLEAHRQRGQRVA